MQDGIGVMTMNRPDKRNALDGAMREKIADVLRRVWQDAAIKALLLTGQGMPSAPGGAHATDRPAKSNALSADLLVDLARRLRRLGARQELDLLVLKGGGPQSLSR